MKKINAQNNLPTLDELKRYHEGGLDATQRTAIEAQAAQNPLVAEALEGFAVVPAFAGVPDVSTFLNSAATVGSSSAATAAVAATAKTGFTLWSAKTLIIAGISGAVATTTIVIATQQEKAPITTQEQTTGNTTTSNQDEETATLPSMAESQPPTLAENDPGTTSVAPLGTTSTPMDEADAERPAMLPIAILPLTNTADSSLATTPAGPQTIQVQTGLAAVGIQKILNYKVADYTKLRSKQWHSFETELNGLPAPFESDEARQQAEKDNVFTTQIPYMQYMRQCIQAMDQQDYALAVKKLKVITEQYPEDVNAQFYTGRCLYLQGQYEKAITLYDASIKNDIRVFAEEAEFYKAKSLKELGRLEEANTLFQQIVKKEKFYAEKAAEELN